MPTPAVLEQPHVAELVLEGGDVLEAEDDAGPAECLRAPDVRRGAHRHDEVGVIGGKCRFQPAMLRIVLSKFSHTEQVQFAAVSPPRRMSSNTAREKFEMISPSMTTMSRCKSFAAATAVLSLTELAEA